MKYQVSFFGYLFFSCFSPIHAQDSMNVKLLFHWNDTTLTAASPYQNRYNDVWGFMQGGREYAVIGSTMGAHIFDVTDPKNAYQAAFVMGADTGKNMIHRDYKDYKGYLYAVCDEGNSTLQIIDLQYLPDSVSVVYDSNILISTSHNIFIDTAEAKLYVCGPKYGSVFGMEVYDLSNPVNPVFLKGYNGSGYIHDVHVRNDTAWCNAFNTSALHVVDFSNPLSPVPLATFSDAGQNHSGWLSPDKPLYVLAREKHGASLPIYDVSDLGNITVSGQLDSGTDSNAIPHNPFIKGDFVFIAYYYDGLQIFNISNPASPVKTGFYDTYPKPNDKSYKGAWGTYPFLPSGIVLLSDMQTGLYVLDVTDALMSSENLNKTDKSAPVFIYPNPFSEHIILKFNFVPATPVFIELKDLVGKTVYSCLLPASGSRMFTLSPFAEMSGGMYIMNVQVNGKQMYMPVAKMVSSN